jgi:hypothetical protein
MRSRTIAGLRERGAGAAGRAGESTGSSLEKLESVATRTDARWAVSPGHLVFTPPGVPHYPRDPDGPDETFETVFVHSPAVSNGDTHTVDEAGRPVDSAPGSALTVLHTRLASRPARVPVRR